LGFAPCSPLPPSSSAGIFPNPSNLQCVKLHSSSQFARVPPFPLATEKVPFVGGPSTPLLSPPLVLCLSFERLLLFLGTITLFFSFPCWVPFGRCQMSLRVFHNFFRGVGRGLLKTMFSQENFLGRPGLSPSCFSFFLALMCSLSHIVLIFIPDSPRWGDTCSLGIARFSAFFFLPLHPGRDLDCCHLSPLNSENWPFFLTNYVFSPRAPFSFFSLFIAIRSAHSHFRVCWPAVAFLHSLVLEDTCHGLPDSLL